MAKAIASRLLHEPTLRMQPLGRQRRGLPLRQRPARAVRARRRDRAGGRGAGANVTELRRQDKAEALRGAAHRHPRQRAGADPGAARSPRCSAGPSWSRSPPTASRATSRASCAGSSGRCWPARPRSASTRPRTCRRRCRRAWDRRGAGARGPGRRLDRRRRLARGRARGRPGRHRQPAPPRPAARRAPRPAGGGAARQRRHPPAQARRGRARRDRPRRRRPAPARPRGRDRLRDPGRADDPGGRARARWCCRSAADDEATRRGRGGDRRRDGAARADRRARRRRPARRDLRDARSASTPGSRASGWRSTPSSACPTAASGCATGSRATPSEPAAAGAELAERLLGAGARELLDRAEAWRERIRAFQSTQKERE